MEFFKKNKFLAIGGAVSLVLLIVAGVFLFLHIRQYLADTGEAEGNENTLRTLESQQPGPTEANVQLVASNAIIMEAGLKKLLEELRQGQIEPRKDMHRVVFNSFLKKMIDEMNKAVTQQCLVVPAKFDYGFKAYYSEGRLPLDADVPRLTVQVQMVRFLVDLALQAHIAEIVTIDRQLFEEPAAGTTPTGASPEAEGQGRGGRNQSSVAGGVGAVLYPLEPPDAQGLYTREHFTITMKTRDEKLAELLNLLGNPSMTKQRGAFAVVTKVDVMGAGLSKSSGSDSEAAGRPGQSAVPSPAPSVVASMPAAGEGGGAVPEKPAPPLKREERIVSGMDNITVQLDVDIYRFAADTKEKAKP